MDRNDPTDFRNIQRAQLSEAFREELRIMGLIREFQENSERLAIKILIFTGVLCVGLALIGTHPVWVISLAEIAAFFAWLIATRERSRFDYQDPRGSLERTIDEIRTERKGGT